MLIDEVVELLLKAKGVLGNIPVALWDHETYWYYSLDMSHFELQTIEDGSKRISVGINDFNEDREPDPVSRVDLTPDSIQKAREVNPPTSEGITSIIIDPSVPYGIPGGKKHT